MSNRYSAAVLFDAPLLYYRLGEASGTTAKDSSGNAHNATYSGSGVTYGTAGAIVGDPNTAVTLDGVAGVVTFPTATLPTGASPWSYECWFNSTANAGTALFQLGTASGVQGVNVYVTSVGGTLNLFINGSHSVSSAFVDGTTYHMVVTYDGTTLILYINAVNIVSTAVTANITYGVGLIGNDSFNDFFHGLVDEVAVYGVALSAARISAHYKAGIAANIIQSVTRREDRR